MQLLKPAWVNHNEGQAIFSVDIHPDGTRFATGGQGQGQDASGRVVIWNMKPVISEKHEEDKKCPKLLCLLDQHLGCVNCVRWSQSGRYLASAGDDKVVIIWQLSSYAGGAVFGSNVVNVEWWRCVSTLRGHDGDILDVAWAPHDQYLASVSVDNTVIIWNSQKWPERVRILRGHQGMVKGVTWDPVGTYIASQGDDQTLIVWRTSDWSKEVSITKPFVECGGTTSVLRPSWSPDGQYLVSAHAMNNGGPVAKIIDRENWTFEKDFVGHRKPITSVRFNPNILKKSSSKEGTPVQYCCAAIGSRDRSLSVWFTSLKRPVVVVHEVFEDSVLDLSFSHCGKHLFAVSKDGTMAAITFGVEEMGQPLTNEEVENIHRKKYGKSASKGSLHSATAAIIDNPELLKAREAALKNSATASNLIVNEGTNPKTSPRRGPDKQIERRTADGRRRITPVFIAPDAEGGNLKTFSSFSSSRTDKSNIIIEKLEGIVEPNVTTPSKSSKDSVSGGNSSNSNTPVKTLPSKALLSSPKADEGRGAEKGAEKSSSSALESASEVDEAKTDLTARMESKLSKGTTGESATLNVNLKRKFEEPQPIAVKRKRGRPPLDRSITSTQPPVPPSPSVSAPPPPMVRTHPIAPPPNAGEQVQVGGMVVRNVLPELSLGNKKSFQIMSGDSTHMVSVDNNYKELKSGSVRRGLHRITLHTNGSEKWVTFLTSVITSVVNGNRFIAVTCTDATLHLLDINTGGMLLPPLQLEGKASSVNAEGSLLLLLTTLGHITLWNVEKRSKMVGESVRHLVEGRVTAEGIQGVHLVPAKNSPESSDRNERRRENSNGEMVSRSDILADRVGGAGLESVEVVTYLPAIVLLSGEVFTRCPQLETWLQLGESSSVRQVISAEYLSVNQRNSGDSPLNRMLRYSSQHSLTGRLRNDVTSRLSSTDPDLLSSLTENYLKKMLVGAAFLGSKEDYTFWYNKLITFYIKEAREADIRRVFDELLTPTLGGAVTQPRANRSTLLVSTVMPQHAHLLGTDKLSLLKSLLNELLLLDIQGRLQRLYTEYKELISHQEEAPMDDLMI